jgi:hypothetical protein
LRFWGKNQHGTWIFYSSKFVWYRSRLVLHSRLTLRHMIAWSLTWSQSATISGRSAILIDARSALACWCLSHYRHRVAGSHKLPITEREGGLNQQPLERDTTHDTILWLIPSRTRTYMMLMLLVKKAHCLQRTDDDLDHQILYTQIKQKPIWGLEK